MKKFTIFLFVIVCSCYANAQQPEKLTNDQIVKLYKAGFSKDVLKSKIQNSSANFDVSIDGMLNLKKAGIPEEIINLMIANPGGVTVNNNIDNTGNSGNTNQGVNEQKKFNLSSGIYYQTPAGEYVEIEPSVLTNTKSKSGVQLLLGGLFNAKVMASLSDKQSSFVVNESLPKIVFVFDTTSKSSLNNDNNSWFGNVRSPKEFLLVKLDINKNSREITIGKGNAMGSNYGIDDKSIVHFTSKKIAAGVYEIMPESALLTGEYCLMFAQGIKQGASSKVFDFSIKSQKGF